MQDQAPSLKKGDDAGNSTLDAQVTPGSPTVGNLNHNRETDSAETPQGTGKGTEDIECSEEMKYRKLDSFEEG